MTRFKERLWRELVRDHGAELASISQPARRGRAARPRLLAGTTAALAGAGAAVALVLGAASTSPAFAVSNNHDGTVSVVVTQLGAIHGLNARLATLGYRARFVQVMGGCAVPSQVAVDLLRLRHTHVAAVTVDQGSVHARFDPRKIPAGQTLVVSAWRAGHQIRVTAGHVLPGAAPACLPGPPPLRLGQVIAVYRRGGTVRCVVTARTWVRSDGRGGITAEPLTGSSAPAPTGNSGTTPTGNSGTTSTGNSGTTSTGNSGQVAAPAGNSGPAPTGNSGATPTGNSGTTPTGNSGTTPAGNSGAPPPGVVQKTVTPSLSPATITRLQRTLTCPTWTATLKPAPKKSPVR